MFSCSFISMCWWTVSCVKNWHQHIFTFLAAWSWSMREIFDQIHCVKKNTQHWNWWNKRWTEKHEGSEIGKKTQQTDKNIQCLKIMSINWAYWQFGANNSVVCFCVDVWVCVCVLGCVRVVMAMTALLEALTCSCVIVLSRKWCHLFVLVPSWDGKRTREEYLPVCLAACLYTHFCLCASVWWSCAGD